MITVKQLRKQLAPFPDDAKVVLSQDSEGNEFRPLAEATYDVYVPANEWRGELIGEHDPRPANAVDACVLWPIN